MILQLDPPLPVTCPKGSGYALFLIDYGQEHQLMWTIAIDDTGEIWTFVNPLVRVQQNITMNRIFKKKNQNIQPLDIHDSSNASPWYSDLSPRTIRFLKSSKLDIMSDLLKLTKLDISKHPNFSMKSFREIEEALLKYNVKLNEN